MEFLEDNMAAADDDGDDTDDDEYTEEDYELLQRDLDKANARLEELESKHDFIRARLEAYRSKIRAAEDFLAASNGGSSSSSGSSNDEDGDEDEDDDAPRPSALTPERRKAMAEKIESYKKSLQPIEEIYQKLSFELSSHQRKIESMQERQLDLKLKTEECKVVLEELSYSVAASGRDNTTTASTETGPSSDDPILVAEMEGNDSEKAIDRVSLEDEDANDLENAETDRQGDGIEDGEVEQKDDTKFDTAIESNMETLSVPVGSDTKIE